MSEPRFDSPLAAQAQPRNPAVSITEIRDRGMLDLRGELDNPAFAGAAMSVLGIALPRLPRSSAAAGDLFVLWLSVDQWLVQCPRPEAANLARRLQGVLTDFPSLVADMSDARIILRLEGDGVREVLMKGAPVDLTAPAFSKGSVRRLRFGEVAAMVHMIGEAPDIIDLYVFRSYAVFAWEWLSATADSAAGIRLFHPQAAPTA